MNARQLKRTILNDCDAIQAILAFNCQLGPDSRTAISSVRKSVETATTRQLRDIQTSVADDVNRIARQFGCKQSPHAIAAFLNAQTAPEAELTNISKLDIDRSFFSAFGGGAIRDWGKYPAHVLISIDLSPNAPYAQLRYFLPENALYTDMCLAYNLACDTEPAIRTGVRRRALEHALHLRTALLSAYYFVEAYLNGIAFDYVAAYESSLDPATKDLLLEWNSAKNTKSYKSVEKKIDEYPRIVLGLSNTPDTLLLSTNRAVLIGEAKHIRDSVVHHSPKVDPETGLPTKLRNMLQLRLSNVAEAVDAAVGLVIEIGTLLGRGPMVIEDYTQRQNGRFPEYVFEETKTSRT